MRKAGHNLPENAKLAFQGVIFDVYQWQQELFDGTSATFEKIQRNDTTTMLAVTTANTLLIVEQEQPHKGKFTGLPGGRVEEGEDPKVAAVRELMEETGYEVKPENLELYNESRPFSKIDWSIFNYIARSCEKKGELNLDAGERIQVREVPWEEFVELALANNLDAADLSLRFCQAALKPEGLAELRKKILGD